MARAQSRFCKRAFPLSAFLICFPFVAAAQQSLPHAESCTQPTWGYLRATDDAYGTVNICSYAVEVWFLAKDGRASHGIAAPGKTFSTGLKAPAFVRTQGWIAATCRAGYVPSIAVSAANWDMILNSQYTCQKK